MNGVIQFSDIKALSLKPIHRRDAEDAEITQRKLEKTSVLPLCSLRLCGEWAFTFRELNALAQ